MIRVHLLAIVAAALLLIAPTAARAQRYTLFSGGATGYDIVVGNNASESEKNAAKELQNYLKQVSGATFAILQSPARGRHYISIGYNDLCSRALGLSKAPDESSDAYTYCTKDGNIYIYGSRKRGSMYGVFAFLEDQTGIRWYAPGVTKIPTLRRYRFAELSRSSAPAIAMRSIAYHNTHNAVWSAHNRVNGNPSSTIKFKEWGDADCFWSCHTTGVFMPASEFFAAHPEYFALRDGKRIADGQLCLSNPDVLRICTERLIAAIRREPAYAIYDLSQKDNQLYCQCSKCTAIANRYGGQSGLWLWFVNQAAREVKKVYPDKYVGTFAYQYTRTPPRGIRPDDNVVVRLCSIECCFMHSLEGCTDERNQRFVNDLRAWSEIAPHLYIWDYVTAFSQYVAPFPDFAVLGPNIRTFADNKSIGVVEEGQYSGDYGEFSELRAYLLARLLWDPDQNTDSLAHDFINAFYGSQATVAGKYYDMVCALVRPDVHQGIYPQANAAIYTDGFIDRAITLLSAGVRAARTTEERQRMEHLWMAPAYLRIRRDYKRAKADGSFDEFFRIARRDNIQLREGQKSIDDIETEIERNGR